MWTSSKLSFRLGTNSSKCTWMARSLNCFQIILGMKSSLSYIHTKTWSFRLSLQFSGIEVFSLFIERAWSVWPLGCSTTSDAQLPTHLPHLSFFSAGSGTKGEHGISYRTDNQELINHLHHLLHIVRPTCFERYY